MENDAPPGWEKLESRSKPGKFYYFNETTGVTSWKRPIVPQAAAAAKKPRRPLPPTPSFIARAKEAKEAQLLSASPNNIPPPIVPQRHAPAPLAPSTSSTTSTTTTTTTATTSLHHQRSRTIKFTPKLIISIDKGRHFSTSAKNSYFCELSLWKSTTMVSEEEEYETERAEGLIPSWNQQFHFGQTINLETEVDYVHIKIFKKTMFSSKHLSSIKIMLLPLRTNATKDGNKQQKEQRWHEVELHRAKKKMEN